MASAETNVSKHCEKNYHNVIRILKPFVFEQQSNQNDQASEPFVPSNHRNTITVMHERYDLNKDGKIDADEQRRIVHDLIHMEDVSKFQKKLVIILSVSILVLTIANIGTAYLAVRLAKDLKISDGVMKDMSGANVKTQVRSINILCTWPPTFTYFLLNCFIGHCAEGHSL